MINPDFSKGGGLLPAVAQDWQTGEVLMLAYISAESWIESLNSGYATYFSRSRQKLWKKGEESGNLQKIHSVLIDCDCDAVIFKVEQIGGAACHTGHRSCFFRRREENGEWTFISEPIFDPEKVYVKKEK